MSNPLPPFETLLLTKCEICSAVCQHHASGISCCRDCTAKIHSQANQHDMAKMVVGFADPKHGHTFDPNGPSVEAIKKVKQAYNDATTERVPCFACDKLTKNWNIKWPEDHWNNICQKCDGVSENGWRDVNLFSLIEKRTEHQTQKSTMTNTTPIDPSTLKVGDRITLTIQGESGPQTREAVVYKTADIYPLRMILSQPFSDGHLSSWNLNSFASDGIEMAKKLGFVDGKFGWQMNEKTTIHSVNGNVLEEKQAATKIDPSTLKIGDKLSITIQGNNGPEKREAIVYSLKGDHYGEYVRVLIDKPFDSTNHMSWDLHKHSGENIGTAKKLGFVDGRYGWELNSITTVDSVNGNALEETKIGIDIDALKLQDIIEFEYRHGDNTYIGQGIVQALRSEEPRDPLINLYNDGVLLAEKTGGNGTHTIGWQAYGIYREQAKNIGLDPNTSKLYFLNKAARDKITITRIIGKHIVELPTLNEDDVKIGSKVLVSVNHGKSTVMHEAIYLGQDIKGSCPYNYYFPVPFKLDNWQKTYEPDDPSFSSLAMKKLGLWQEDKETDNCLSTEDCVITINKVLATPSITIGPEDIDEELAELQMEDENEEDECEYSDCNPEDELDEDEDEDEDDDDDEEDPDPITVIWDTGTDQWISTQNHMAWTGIESPSADELKLGDRVEVEISSYDEPHFKVRALATVISTKGKYSWEKPHVALDHELTNAICNRFVDGLSLFDMGGCKVSAYLNPDYENAAKQYNIPLDKQVVFELDSETTILRKLDTTQSKGNQTMMDLIKSDAVNAGYRVAATQITKGTKTAVLAMMKDKGMEGNKLAAFSEMMETELGSALVATFLGYGLTYMPKLGDDPRAQRLAKEFRINGMATAGNTLADAVVTHLMPSIKETMKNLPALPEAPKTPVKKPAKKKPGGGGLVVDHSAHNQS